MYKKSDFGYISLRFREWPIDLWITSTVKAAQRPTHLDTLEHRLNIDLIWQLSGLLVNALSIRANTILYWLLSWLDLAGCQ